MELTGTTETIMQFRLNLITCWFILGIVTLVLHLWLPLLGVVIVAALLGPKVTADHETWSLWLRVEDQLADCERQRAVFARHVERRGMLRH